MSNDEFQNGQMTCAPVERRVIRSEQTNCGFWDRPADERSEMMSAACGRAGVESFGDLSPEERGRAYDDV